MKNKKNIKLLIATALVANLLLVSVAAATSETTSSQTVAGGSLQINYVPPAINFANITASTSDQVSTVNFTFAGVDWIEFQDMEGFADTGAWDVQVRLKPFENTTYPSSGTLDFAQMRFLADRNLAPTVAAVGQSTNCNVGIDIPVGQETYTAFADDGSGTQSAAINLVHAIEGAYTDVCQISPEIKLTFPGGESPGVWTSTMTFSIL